MADYYLNLTTWHMEVSGGKVREVLDGIEEMTQRIGIAIKTHLGEVLLDTTRGLPWGSEILIKNPNLSQITSYARAYLLTIEGVVGIRKLAITMDGVARTSIWDLDIETTKGITGPFKVSVTF